MSDSEILVRAGNVSKKFCRSLKKSLWYGLKDMAAELVPFGKKKSEVRGQKSDLTSDLRPPTSEPASDSDLRPGEFWAVRDVSFELRRGECLGLVGRNGAGKTTLLKMLNGLIKPDTGRIEMRGRVGALIALGAGFNPILTGRENIYVNGSVLGLSKEEIDAKIGDIIDFAGIAEFIDSPVQSYSSGMQVRLGFSVATALDPDVLILDEVLAVGDASFRHKCYHRIHKIIKKCAVIFVSHSMDQIGSIASSVGLMQKGRFQYFPSYADGVQAYNQANTDQLGQADADGGEVFETYPPVRRARLNILNPVADYGGALDVELELECTEAVQDVILSFTAVSQKDQPVMNWNLSRAPSQVDLPAGTSVFRFRIDPLLLHDGAYRWNLWLGRKGSIEALIYAMRAGKFVVRSAFQPCSEIPYLPQPADFELIPEPRSIAGTGGRPV